MNNKWRTSDFSSTLTLIESNWANCTSVVILGRVIFEMRDSHSHHRLTTECNGVENWQHLKCSILSNCWFLMNFRLVFMWICLKCHLHNIQGFSTAGSTVCNIRTCMWSTQWVAKFSNHQLITRNLIQCCTGVECRFAVSTPSGVLIFACHSNGFVHVLYEWNYRSGGNNSWPCDNYWMNEMDWDVLALFMVHLMHVYRP